MLLGWLVAAIDATRTSRGLRAPQRGATEVRSYTYTHIMAYTATCGDP